MKTPDEFLAVYSRKSRFTGRGESIENQIELCRAYIVSVYGDRYADRLLIYEDEGFSGGNTQRPALRRLLRDAEAGRFQAVVVYRLDRISRNIGDFARLIQELAEHGIAFVSIREQFDTASPMGRAMMYIASVFSQLERETIAERIRDNMRQLARTGRWLGGVTPTGFRSESVQRVSLEGKTKRSCKLTVIPEEAALVQEIFALFEKTESLSAVEAELLRRREKTKTNRPFTRFAIKGILQNPVYLKADQAAYRYFTEKGSDIAASQEDFDGYHGLLAYHRTAQENKGAARFLPEREWIVSVGGHEGLIPSERWLRAQELLDQNKEKAYRRPRKHRALLTGLLFCSCGSRMVPRLSGKGEGFSYTCAMKLHSQKSRCGVTNADGLQLDSLLLTSIKEMKTEPGLLLRCLEDKRTQLMALRPEPNADLARLTRAAEENRQKIQALVEALAETKEQSIRREIAGRLDTLGRENAAIAEKIEACRAEHKTPDTGATIEKLCSFPALFDEMSREEKRAALKKLVQRVVWDGERATVFFSGFARKT